MLFVYGVLMGDCDGDEDEDEIAVRKDSAAG